MDFCLSQKNIGKNVTNKYGQKLLDSAKKSTADTIRTASKRAIQKIEATGHLIGNKIADKITSFLKNFDDNNEMEASKRRNISPEERQKIIDELRMV